VKTEGHSNLRHLISTNTRRPEPEESPKVHATSGCRARAEASKGKAGEGEVGVVGEKKGKRIINGIVGSVEKREKREMEREKGFPFSFGRRTGAIIRS